MARNNNLLYYCHICGSILDREDVYKLIVTERTPKQKRLTRTLYQLCGKCLHNVEHRRYKMENIKDLKQQHIYALYKQHLATKKKEKLYDIFNLQLETLEKLEVKKEKLVLKTKTDKRIWTVFNVKNLIETNDTELCKLMYQLFQYQDEDEKKERKTKWQNAVGFNQADASFLTGMARIYEAKGKTKEAFNKNQLRGIRRRMLKYAHQITIILNA